MSEGIQSINHIFLGVKIHHQDSAAAEAEKDSERADFKRTSSGGVTSHNHRLKHVMPPASL
jgi:hypothetical protein